MLVDGIWPRHKLMIKKKNATSLLVSKTCSKNTLKKGGMAKYAESRALFEIFTWLFVANCRGKSETQKTSYTFSILKFQMAL